MAKKPTPSMADIELDAGVITLPVVSQGASGTSRNKPTEGIPMEKFQVHIPAEIATEVRMEAAKRKKSNSALFLEAWAMWKQNPPESY